MFSYAQQAQAFLASVYAGLIAGVAYDLLRLFRLLLKAGRVITALIDIVFWVLAAAVLALAAALSGVEGLRFYLLLGLLSGLLLWSAGLRRVVHGLCGFFLNTFGRKHEGNGKGHGE